jgi:hypothetical protein
MTALQVQQESTPLIGARGSICKDEKVGEVQIWIGISFGMSVIILVAYLVLHSIYQL